MKTSAVRGPVQEIGRAVLALIQAFTSGISEAGSTFLLLKEVAIQLFSPPVRWRLALQQVQFIGVSSIFIVVLTGSFTGMVFALQSGRAFALFRAETLTGAVASIAIARELGPVLTALMVTARAGSAMAAQLGTMQVTQQVDALISLAVHPVHYLIVPRVLAAVVALPLLTAVFDFVGALGTYVVGVKLLQIDEGIFVQKIQYYADVPDIVQGMFKAAVFGLIIAIVSCYKGYYAHGGAAGVGRATTQAVVISSVAILVSDYFLTALLF
ncbi:MAG TPA: ABC transporter permease [Bdellovibrionota bacterium]|nr:ABC transporter permease [Bdellovibrionota bacterium]